MQVRIVAYNIRYGGVGRAHLITEVLRSISPHVAILIEAGDPYVVQTIAHSLDMEWIIAEGSKAQLALLSSIPILSWDNYCPRWLGRPLLEATLRISPHQSITVFGVHLQPHYFRWNERRRVAELETYLHRINQREPGSHLLAGDFNAIAPGDRVNRERLPLKESFMIWWEGGRVYHDAITHLLERGYIDCFRALHPTEDGFTFPVQTPNVRLDYIFVDQSMYTYLEKCLVVTFPATTLCASDHYPVLAVFELE